MDTQTKSNLRTRRPGRTAALVLVLGAALAACGSSSKSSGPTTSAVPASSSTTPPTTTTTGVGPTTTTAPATPVTFVYPFRDLTEVRAWQRSYESGGHQPWHLDADITSTSFAAFLGYTSAGRVMSSRADASGSYVALGFRNPNGAAIVATTIHLVRVGTGADAPWEVVGDLPSSTLSLTTPALGATVASPVRVGGQVTGVDESLHVQLRSLGSSTAVADRCCIAAGGEHQPWSTQVTFERAADPLLIAVSTGGHLQAVEHFAFTAVHPTGAGG